MKYSDKNKLNDKNIIELLTLLDIAKNNCPDPVINKTQNIVHENFDCNNICSKSAPKTLFELDETKYTLLLFGLIMFYAYIKI